MNDFEETQKLIRLKRYEKPPGGYFDGFLDEFHQRQRAELMQRSSVSLFFERLSTFLSELGGSRLVLAGGAAAAIALAVLINRPQPSDQEGVASGLPSNFDAPVGEVTPVSSDMLDPDLNNVEDAAPRFRMAPSAKEEPQTFEL